MQRTKPKSAPPRLKSKFVKNRTNAMKEIEAWVRKDNESYSVPEASRMSGQLSDNVTEERMLKAKLWELSKERYKFLSQNTYEKKVFQDRQQKKAGLRRVVSASADGRQRHSSGDPAVPERRSSFGDTTSRPRVRNARLALLDRLDPTKGKKSAIKKSSTDETNDSSSSSNSKPSHSKVLSRGNSSASVLNRNEPLNASGLNRNATPPAVGKRNGKSKSRTQTPTTGNNEQENPPPTTPRRLAPQRMKSMPVFPRRAPMFADDDQSPSSRQSPAPGANPQSNSTFVVNPASSEQTASSSQQSQTGLAISWQNKAYGGLPLKYGMKIESKTADPRYSSLERKLSPLVRSKTEGDIGSIVNNMESLHVRPKKRPTDANRSKIEVKAWEFMKEKGFAF